MTAEAIQTAARDSADDDQALIRMMVAAYGDDPFINWVVRKDGKRDAAWNLFFRTSVERYRPLGALDTVGGGGGCALWAPPGKFKLSTWEELRLAPRIIRILGLARLKHGLGALETMDAQHPAEPHYYLYMIAVDPAAQGRGHGSALLRAGLERVDNDGLGAFLETSNPRNLPLYRRHGFEVVKELLVAPDAPNLWFMWRPPRPKR